jgi:hypothetical protein
LPDREKGKRHSRSFFERKLGWHQKAVAGLNAHVFGIRAAFPLSHQAPVGAQVLAIGQTKFANVAAGGGIKSYAITEPDTSHSCARGNNSAGAVAADDMWEVDRNAEYAVANEDNV